MSNASDWRAAADRYASPAGPDMQWPVPAPYVYNATVVNVHDGDTVNVTMSYGFHRYDSPVPIRLLGCNAAELATPGGKAARDNLVALLPPGTEVVLATATPDKYAPRVDAAVTFLQAGVPTDLVGLLIEQQWAAPWDGTGKAPVPPWPRTVA